MAWFTDDDAVSEIKALSRKIDAKFAKLDKLSTQIDNLSEVSVQVEDLDGVLREINETLKGETIMKVLEDLTKAVADLTVDMQADQDQTRVAIDTIRQLVQDDSSVSDTVRAAVDKLVEVHNNSVDTTKRLKEATDSVLVSGGLVSPEANTQPELPEPPQA